MPSLSLIELINQIKLIHKQENYTLSQKKYFLGFWALNWYREKTLLHEVVHFLNLLKPADCVMDQRV
jgi:hypothetical protein